MSDINRVNPIALASQMLVPLVSYSLVLSCISRINVPWKQLIASNARNISNVQTLSRLRTSTYCIMASGVSQSISREIRSLTGQRTSTNWALDAASASLFAYLVSTGKVHSLFAAVIFGAQLIISNVYIKSTPLTVKEVVERLAEASNRTGLEPNQLSVEENIKECKKSLEKLYHENTEGLDPNNETVDTLRTTWGRLIRQLPKKLQLQEFIIFIDSFTSFGVPFRGSLKDHAPKKEKRSEELNEWIRKHKTYYENRWNQQREAIINKQKLNPEHSRA